MWASSVGLLQEETEEELKHVSFLIVENFRFPTAWEKKEYFSN